VTDAARIVEAESVESLLVRMASATPAAGGGAAAALTGAAAAALVGMVAGVAARHAQTDAALAGVADDARALSRRLVALIGMDEAAYGDVIEARRRDDPDRAAAERRALRRATEIPLEVAGASATVLVQAATLVDVARPSTVVDLGAAAALAGAALEAAALTARVNLAELDDPEFVHDAGQALERLLAQGMTVRQRLVDVIAGRTAGRTTTPPR
jgi:formiminotetrahydrofolate cyclodeaminase